MFFLNHDFRRLRMVGGMLFHIEAPSLEKEFYWIFSLEYFKQNLSELTERVLYEWTLSTLLNRVTIFLVLCDCLRRALKMQYLTWCT